MPTVQVRVAAPTNVSATDNNVYDLLGGKSQEAIVSELHGKYFTQTYRGRLWHASITAATAIPAFATNATPNFGIFNPAGNNTAVVLARFNVGFAAGTGIAGQIGYAYLNPAGTAPAGTAAPVSAYTAGPAIQSGVAGGKYAGNIIFGSSFTIGGVVSALTIHKWANLSQGAPITTTAAMYSLFEDFDGTVIVPPNTLWCPVASAAIAETSMITLRA